MLMFAGVPAVDPGHALVDLLRVGIDALAGDGGHDAFVAIDRFGCDFRLLAKAQLGEGLPGAGAEWLPLLRRIDPGQADPVLAFCGSEDGQGIAIGDGNHFSRECLRVRCREMECACGNQRKLQREFQVVHVFREACME